MPNLIDGMPLHPLVVHGVVVLIPLAVLGTILIAIRPSWRTKYGTLVVLISAVATALVPVAKRTGEALADQLGEPGAHSQMGGQLIWFAIPMLLSNLALVWMSHRNAAAAGQPGARKAIAGSVVTGVAVLSVIASLAAGVQVVRVGDSGARAVWSERVPTK
jgi:hypothetical protein